jgi:hypothetical protein
MESDASERESTSVRTQGIVPQRKVCGAAPKIGQSIGGASRTVESRYPKTTQRSRTLQTKSRVRCGSSEGKTAQLCLCVPNTGAQVRVDGESRRVSDDGMKSEKGVEKM